MSDINVVLPSKPKIVLEKDSSGVYEIDGLYPGYGHTLGNSLRRIILSSLPGTAVTHVKIAGVSHEFSTISGVKEDVITILLNLKRLRIKMSTDEPQVLSVKVKGVKDITAADIKAPGQIEILNSDLHIASLTDKNAELDMEITVARGLGYVSKDVLQKDRVDIGTISLDATFTPIRRVNYEVENMRVGDRTDFNRLKISIETDGTVTPHEALERSISIMINQLKAIVGFKEEEIIPAKEEVRAEASSAPKKELDTEFLKTRIETLGMSQRTTNALANANIRTVGGLVRKKEMDIENIEGLGPKGIQEIKKALSEFGITLK
ncbi:MAG: DNA-directed RNA polymerase subunit alpha [Candidatus Taylorbacteria bacterium]|nr:DNA-directed RNA polymerase subunit alpha [Candidatus Taylorbacteria bacterium]